jgi:integrase
VPRRRKRRRGEGSIYRRADGYYVAAYVVGRDHRGRTKRKVIYGKSREAVEDALLAIRHVLPNSPTIAEYLDRWVKSDAFQHLHASTRYHYCRCIERYIKPFIGGYDMREIDVERIRSYIQELKKATKSVIRQRQTLHILQKAFGLAVDEKIVDANPVKLVPKPKYVPNRRRSLTVEEARRLLVAAKGDRYEAVYVLAITAGLRIGEILGLRWEDVDLDAGTVTIFRTISDPGGRRQEGPPKTASSRRTIYLSRLAIEALRGLSKGQKGYIFLSPRGNPIVPTWFAQYPWAEMRKKAALEGVVFHQLRHTAATLRLQAGTHPVIVQELLGHSSVSITLDIYSHATADLHRESAEKVDEILDSGYK